MKESRSTIKTQGTWVEMGSGITPGGVQSGLQFPWKLHFLLEEVEKRGQTAIVSWLPDGMSFKVHQKEQFARDVMPEFFNTTAYKSFQRNLNLWGFKTVPKGPNKGRCSHRWLIRNKPELCQYMKRTTGKKSDSSQSQDDNPSSGDSQRGSSVAGASSNRTSSTSQQSPPLIQGKRAYTFGYLKVFRLLTIVYLTKLDILQGYKVEWVYSYLTSNGAWSKKLVLF